MIGPYFFEHEAGRAVTVNSARYTEMLRTFLEPKLQRLGVETPQTLWFQQDGETAHAARTAKRVLNEMFSARVISRMACKIARSQRMRLLPLGISQERRCTKRNQGQLWT